ncbi:MAG: hypothetical protein JNK49_16860 [Planctomycetes bacterium]|nr:hypothetical protein [Planctomycetota bacterium]
MRTASTLVRLSFAALATPWVAPLPAQLPNSGQHLVAANWDGRLHVVDAQDGSHELLASAGMGQNCLARDPAERLWSTARLPNGTAFSFHLALIDPVARSSALMFPSLDLRGLARAPGGLYGIETQPSGLTSRLWHIDTQTGQHTLRGPVGLTAIQSLAVVGNTLYGWHWVQGLVVLDPNTGAAADPFPATANNVLLQWLCETPGGGLLGGTSTGLYDVDLGTGGLTLRTALVPPLDLRGAEFAAFALPFGRGCEITSGPITLGALGVLQAGRTVTLLSSNHLPNSLRALAVGFSREQFRGQSLPAPIDALIGTPGCSLHVSPDLTQFYGASGFPTSVMALPLPLIAGLGEVYVQVFDFGQPFGRGAASNGLWLHLR